MIGTKVPPVILRASVTVNIMVSLKVDRDEAYSLMPVTLPRGWAAVVTRDITDMAPPAVTPTLTVVVSQFLCGNETETVITNPGEGLVGSTPTSCYLCSAPNTEAVATVAEKRTVAGNKVVFELGQSVVVSLVTCEVAIEPVPGDNRLDGTSKGDVVSSPFL